jgi:SAM-dependent methyltransferase
MGHPEQWEFFAVVAKANSPLLERGDIRVLEVGSYSVNGSIRDLYPAAEYTGVDLVNGPCVDVVGYGHEVSFPDGYFDVTLSGECFEHDPHWRATFENMVRMTRPGGLVAFTCASRGRPEHGTIRTGAHASPGTQAVGLNHYRNLDAPDFSELPLGEMFSTYRFWYLATHFDLFFAGVRAGGTGASLPESTAVESLASMMSVGHRLARMPLRVALKVAPNRYQSFAAPYWETVHRTKESLLHSLRGVSGVLHRKFA